MSSIQGVTVEEIHSNARERMLRTVEDFRHEITSIRTGRASIHLLDNVRVDYYGTPTPVSQVATVSTPDPSLITIQPWDVSQIGAIERAIQSANLGVNPTNDGKLIRLAVPPLTGDRRKELVKQLHQVTEKHRVAVRNLRRDANDALKKLNKDNVISDDATRQAQEDVQKFTDETINELEAVSAAKEKEITEL